MPNRPMPGSGGRGRPAPEPKPFSKVVTSQGKARRDVTGHHQFAIGSYTGHMACTLTTLTPVHVGSGIYELARDNPVRGLITVDGMVIVPGTSLKGAIRSIAEAISPSCLRVVKRDIAQNFAIHETRPCDELQSRTRNKNQAPQLCVCCTIFGALGYQGRVSFTDAHLATGGTAIHAIQAPYPPRESARGYKDTRQRFDGRKIYYHGQPVASPRGEPYQVITANSRLQYTVHFESLTAQEFCLLLVAMGILDNLAIKIGGGKQAMLGSVRMTPTSLTFQDVTASFTDFTSGTREVTESIASYLQEEVGATRQLINTEAFEALKKLWTWPSNRKAPTGIY